MGPGQRAVFLVALLFLPTLHETHRKQFSLIALIYSHVLYIESNYQLFIHCHFSLDQIDFSLKIHINARKKKKFYFIIKSTN